MRDDFNNSPALKALRVIKNKHPKKKGVSGVIICPECGAESQYSIAKSNGHVSWRCTKCGNGFIQ